jgi:epoxyqueuosine reductase
MKEAIRQRARELGFDDCRFTTAQPPESAPRFQQWLAEGRHGDMAYLARNAHKRIEPREVLPGAKSVVALAVSYDGEGRTTKSEVRSSKFSLPPSIFHPPSSVLRPTAIEIRKLRTKGLLSSAGGEGEDVAERPKSMAVAPRSPSSTPSGFIARYARYRDYHDVLGERLKQLAEFIDQLGGPGARSLWYVDTGPVLERDLAQRAGLGFIGKHTNLISRHRGNWIFLSEILTTLELEPDAPERNRCGSCARCIAACPTGAITGPFQLDARRCISYLTIELKGPIPVELRAAVGNRIYGCDDCLAACPWNRFARAGELMGAHARQDLEAPELLELLGLDEAAFRRRFAGTPLLRVKRRGLLRNVCVALGNTAGQEALPALRRAAGDPEPLIAEHAQWAIGQIEKRRLPTLTGMARARGIC